MIVNKLDMYRLIGYEKEQLLVYWLCWLYPCHHEKFLAFCKSGQILTSTDKEAGGKLQIECQDPLIFG